MSVSLCCCRHEEPSFTDSAHISALQLDNVLLHEDGRPTVRLCDFGSSKLDALNSMCRSYTGTCEYMAPEVLFESQVCAPAHRHRGLIMSGAPSCVGFSLARGGLVCCKALFVSSLLYGFRRDLRRCVSEQLSRSPVGSASAAWQCADRTHAKATCLFSSQYDGAAADVYSCGVSLYVLLSGEFPFSRADEDEGATMVVRLQRELRRALAGDVQPLPQVPEADGEWLCQCVHVRVVYGCQSS